MFTQEEFESAYEIISGFNNIRKQINDDSKLLSKFYDIYKNRGLEIEKYSVNSYIKTYIRNSVLNCYFSLGYPREYNRNVFAHFDILSELFLEKDNKLDYAEYEYMT